MWKQSDHEWDGQSQRAWERESFSLTIPKSISTERTVATLETWISAAAGNWRQPCSLTPRYEYNQRRLVSTRTPIPQRFAECNVSNFLLSPLDSATALLLQAEWDASSWQSGFMRQKRRRWQPIVFHEWQCDYLPIFILLKIGTTSVLWYKNTCVYFELCVEVFVNLWLVGCFAEVEFVGHYMQC